MRNQENKYLKAELYDALISDYPNGFTIKDLLDCFGNEETKLLQMNGVELLNTFDVAIVKLISQTIPHFQTIVNKPKTYIKTLEEITPIDRAKRINKQAISRLSMNSEDWYARTKFTVIPKRISSDLIEEKLEIYENIVVKTLIDKLIKFTGEQLGLLKSLNDEIEDREFDYKVQTQLSYQYYSGANKNSKPLKINDLEYEVHDKILSFIKEIEKIQNVLISLTKTEFYKKLSRFNIQDDFIHNTNIFVYDPHYSAIYKLWIEMYKDHKEESFDLDFLLDENVDDFYFTYVFINIIATLYQNNYTLITDSILMYNENKKLVMKSPIRWTNNVCDLTLRIDSEAMKIYFCLDFKDKKIKSDKFILNVNYVDLSSEIPEDFRIVSNKLISNMIENNKDKSLSGNYYCVSVDFSEKKCVLEPSIYRRFYNIGDNYSDEEKNIDKISNYKTGIFIINPKSYYINRHSIQRLLNSHILRKTIVNIKEPVCPLCGSTKVKIKNNEIVCYGCNYKSSISSCSNCKDRNILWIRFNDDSFFKTDEIKDFIDQQKYYNLIKRSQLSLGANAITSFDIEIDRGKIKYKSICPKCGVLLGDLKQK